MKTRERQEARRLRQEEGSSVKNIAGRLGVAPSTVSLWVRDIELTTSQLADLRFLEGMHPRQVEARCIRSARARALRVAAQEEGRRVARRGEPLHSAGCMLYWAEGAKARNAVRFVNSDPELVCFFVTFLRTYFDVATRRFE